MGETKEEGPDCSPLGVTRREALRRGAILGGTLLWAAPAVQTIRMSPAFAQNATPRGKDISFIGMNVECEDGMVAVPYTIKYEGCEGMDCFESDPGKFPECAFFTPTGTKADGDVLGFAAIGPDPTTGCVTIIVPPNCTVINSAVKAGQECCPGVAGTGTLVFCPPEC